MSIKFQIADLSGGKSLSQLQIRERTPDLENLFKNSRCSSPGRRQFAKIAFEAIISNTAVKAVFACLKFPTDAGIAVEAIMITGEGVIRAPWSADNQPPVLICEDGDRHVSGISFAYADENYALQVSTSRWWRPKGEDKEKLQPWRKKPPMLCPDEDTAEEVAVILNYLGIAAVVESEFVPDLRYSPANSDTAYAAVMDLLKEEREAYLAKRNKA